MVKIVAYVTIALVLFSTSYNMPHWQADPMSVKTIIGAAAHAALILTFIIESAME